MIRRLLSARRLALAGTATVGLVAGHVLDYLALVRSGDHRSAVLAATGHGYLSDAILASFGAALIAVLSAAALGFAHGRGRDPSRFRYGVLRLCSIQVPGFVGLEIVERLTAGAHLDHLAGSLLAVGVGLQIAVACAGALVLRLIERVAEAVGRALRHRPRIREVQLTATLPRGDLAPRLLFTFSRSVRAPPALISQPV